MCLPCIPVCLLALWLFILQTSQSYLHHRSISEVSYAKLLQAGGVSLCKPAAAMCLLSFAVWRVMFELLLLS